jgi:hypothetical protein
MSHHRTDTFGAHPDGMKTRLIPAEADGLPSDYMRAPARTILQFTVCFHHSLLPPLLSLFFKDLNSFLHSTSPKVSGLVLQPQGSGGRANHI